MSEDIKELNKQIASFILVSAAIAVPVISAAENEQSTEETAKYETRQVMLFYGAPQKPEENAIKIEKVQKPQIVFYGAPQRPDKQVITKEEHKTLPVIAYYAAPSMPTQKEPAEDMSQMQGYKYSVIDDIPEIKQTKEKNTSLWERIKQVFQRNNDK